MNSYYPRKLLRLQTTFSKIYCNRSFFKVIPNSIHQPNYSTCSSKTEDSNSDALFEENDFELFPKTETVDLVHINFEEVCGNDPEKIETLKLFQLEIQLWAQEGLHIPQKITPTIWQKLLNTSSKYKRKELLQNTRLKELINEKKKIKQQAYHERLQKHKEELENKPPNTTASPVQYGLQNTTLFHRIRESHMEKLYNHRLLQASMFGPHILIDCGFEQLMTPKDLSFVTHDILRSWKMNREHFYPLNMIFCNFNTEGEVFKNLCQFLPSIQNNPSYPFHHSGKNFLDFFPKKKLIYLTPHCKTEMNSYDPSSVYILGAISLIGHEQPASLAIAKKYGIPTMKFPIDRYIPGLTRSKILPLWKCVSILGELKNRNDWRYAFRNLIQPAIERRNVKYNQQILDRSKRNNTKLFSR